MTTLAHALRRPIRPEVGSDFWIGLGAAGLAGAIGLGVTAGLWLPITALVVFLVALLVGLIDWRISMIAVLAYMPVSGILPLAMFPTTGPGVLAKDFFFIIPAYAGFFGTYIARNRRITFDAAPVGILLMLAVLVLLGSLNPALSGVLVPLIGIKVWLMYIPLLFIGYHLVRDLDDLRFLLALMAITAILPAFIGVVEAVLVYSGRQATVEGWYGDAAGAAFTDYGTVDVGGSQGLARIPSTFTFVAQYYVFVSCMAAMAYAWWRMKRPGEQGWYRLAILALLVVAAFTTGSRGAFIFLPLLFMLIFLLEGQISLRTIGVGILGAGGLLIAITVIGVGIGPLANALWENLALNYRIVILDGIKAVSHHLFAGLGTGSDTQAARHVTERLSTSVGGTWQESWWVKTVYELGILGFIVAIGVFVTLLRRMWSRHKQLTDPGLRAVSAAVIALIIWTIVYGTKGSYQDIDPLNIYFWLFAGITFKLYELAREQGQQQRSLPPSGELEEPIAASGGRADRKTDVAEVA